MGEARALSAGGAAASAERGASSSALTRGARAAQSAPDLGHECRTVPEPDDWLANLADIAAFVIRQHETFH